MELNEYQRLAGRTSDESLNPWRRLSNGCFGMCGEAGECIDLLKKVEFQGHTFDPNRFTDELGDVLWYVAETASGLGLSLEQVAKRNIEKLKARYPQGFEVDKSIHRREYERQ